MPSDSLMPKSDSFNARVRGASHIDFKTSTTGVAAKAMRNELSALVNTVEDPETKKVRTLIHFMPLRSEIDAIAQNQGLRHRDAVLLLPLHPLSFRPRSPPRTVRTRLVPSAFPRTHFVGPTSEWDRIKSPSEDKIVPYAKLPKGSPANLNKLAVLKVNGGLGTSMGEPIPF